MPARLPPHSHCLNCEEPIQENEVFCSEKCEEQHKLRAKKDRRKTMAFYLLLMAAFAIIWIVAALAIG